MHMDIDDQLISENLKNFDRSSYLACLLMGDPHRLPIAVLYAFHAEVSRIRDMIREPLPGEIRLQWWREVTAENARKDEASANPFSNALNQVIERYDLNRVSFDGYCRARIFDLYDDPMPDFATYEGYCGETASILMQLSCQIISSEHAKFAASTSGHAGVAYSVATHLLRLADHRARGQLYIPLELLNETGLDRESFLKGVDEARNAEVIREFASYGENHLRKAREYARDISPVLSDAFLRMANCDSIFKRASKFGARCLVESCAPSGLKNQWDLWRTSRRGIF
ncbi:phytoene/squalene synthase family protein [Lentilitoribacter sp. EG35]|uniref:phytoene/squalene synthase family protein n=1 Tax=Lentilitoribacter sp. EG35 TaxID=3234192 RepID=UPI003460A7DF